MGRPRNALESKDKRWERFFDAYGLVKNGKIHSSKVYDDYGNEIYFWKIASRYSDLYLKTDYLDDHRELVLFCAAILRIHKGDWQRDRNLWDYAAQNNLLPSKNQKISWEGIKQISSTLGMPEDHVSRRLKQMINRPPQRQNYRYYLTVLKNDLLFYTLNIWFIPLECNMPGNPGYLSAEEREEIRRIIKHILTPRQSRISRIMTAIKDIARKGKFKVSNAESFRMISPKLGLSESTLKREWSRIRAKAKEAGLIWYLGRWKLTQEKLQKIGNEYVRIDYFERQPEKGSVIYDRKKNGKYEELKTKRRFFNPAHNSSRRVFYIEEDSDLHDQEDKIWEDR